MGRWDFSSASPRPEQPTLNLNLPIHPRTDQTPHHQHQPKKHKHNVPPRTYMFLMHAAIGLEPLPQYLNLLCTQVPGAHPLDFGALAFPGGPHHLAPHGGHHPAHPHPHMAMDISETDKEYRISCDLPGFKKVI